MKKLRSKVIYLLLFLAATVGIFIGSQTLVDATSLGYPFERRYQVTSPYGMRVHPISGRRKLHTGVDIGAPRGTPVLASRNGTVIHSAYNKGYGKLVILEHQHPREQTFYAHLSQINVQRGQELQKGDVLGYVGSTGYSTGAHLHFELHQYRNGGFDLVNPEQFLGEPQLASQPSQREPEPDSDVPCDRVLFGNNCEPTEPTADPPTSAPSVPELPSCDVALFGRCI